MKMLNIFFSMTILIHFWGCSTISSKPELEVVASLPTDIPPGNIAVGPNGRIFLSVHDFYGKDIRVVELLKDGTTKPYPNDEWAYAAQKKKSGGLYGVLGINISPDGILWMLDTSGPDRPGRLVGWNTKTEKLHRIIYLKKPVIKDHSFLNDFAIDSKNKMIYVADTGTASILVVELNSGKIRRVLEGSDSTTAEKIDMVIDGRVMKLGGKTARLGINPITIDSESEYLYFGAMTGRSVYRVKTEDLRNKSLDDKNLSRKIERYGDKPISDGITMDDLGNIYVTSITDDSIGITTPRGTYETLIKGDDLSWPDGFSIGPDNYVYGTINELHRSPVLNNGKNGSRGEFKVIRFKAEGPTSVGR